MLKRLIKRVVKEDEKIPHGLSKSDSGEILFAFPVPLSRDLFDAEQYRQREHILTLFFFGNVGFFWRWIPLKDVEA